MTSIKQSLRDKAFKEFVSSFAPVGGGGGGFLKPTLTTQVYLNGGSSYVVPVGYKAKINFSCNRYKTESYGYNYIHIKESPRLWIVSGSDDNVGGPSNSYWQTMGIENLYLLAGESVRGHGMTILVELYAV